MLSVAALLDGKYAQAFPSLGSERMGAPINIWNDHSANWGLASRVSRRASPSFPNYLG
jgi:hypothetical protein